MTMVSPARDDTASATVNAFTANWLTGSAWSKRAVAVGLATLVLWEMRLLLGYWIVKALIAPSDRRIARFLSIMIVVLWGSGCAVRLEIRELLQMYRKVLYNIVRGGQLVAYQVVVVQKYSSSNYQW